MLRSDFSRQKLRLRGYSGVQYYLILFHFNGLSRAAPGEDARRRCPRRRFTPEKQPEKEPPEKGRIAIHLLTAYNENEDS